jgi:hypothetical protein
LQGTERKCKVKRPSELVLKVSTNSRSQEGKGKEVEGKISEKEPVKSLEGKVSSIAHRVVENTIWATFFQIKRESKESKSTNCQVVLK